jgi:hypothetical protein
MSGEVWTTPKAWGVENVGTTDFNRIEGNTKVLHMGGGATATATAISANSLALPNETDDVFKVSGSEQIYYIETTHRQPNNRITLISQDGFTLAHNVPFSVPSGYAKVVNAFLTAISIGQYGAVDLVYDGTYWYTKVISS